MGDACASVQASSLRTVVNMSVRSTSSRSASSDDQPRIAGTSRYAITDSAALVTPPEVGFRDSIARAAYEQAGVDPGDLDLAEVYDLSAALELDWYENIGLCKPGEAERLLRDGDTAIGGRIPVNPSGGLACFGEAIPAQAIAQVCELTWQLRGEAGERQVEGAKLGVSANQGLFGHGSSVVVKR